MNTIEYKILGPGIVNLVLNAKNQSKNIITVSFINDLQTSVDQLASEKGLKGVIISSDKASFADGIDFNFIINKPSAEKLFTLTEKFKSSLRKLETLGKPVVSVISGHCLSGGFEMALASHYRIALNDDKIKIGLPDIKLGILPIGGAITRISRLMGLQSAFGYLTDGKTLSPSKTLETGLIHKIVDNREKLIPAAIEWINTHPQVLQPYDEKGYRLPGGNIMHPKMAQIITAAPAVLIKKTRGNYPAPAAVLSVLAEGSVTDLDAAFRIESRYFVKIARGNVAQNMLTTLWYQFNDLKKGNNRPELPPSKPVRKVGVLGAGMMGHGIAYAAARAGYQVVLKDVSMEMAVRGLKKIEAILNKMVEKGRITPEKKQQLLKRINPTDNPKDLQGSDLIIEAVFENRDLKAKVTQEAEPFLSERGIFASNTSTLPISSLAPSLSREDKFIGLHFFSPVHKMQLVEIIKGKNTSEETLAQAFDYVLSIKKIPIVVNDSRGFYTSRVFSTYVEEGLALLSEGQNPQCIESAGLAAGMPVGPLALTDEITLTLVEHINKQTEADLKAQGKTRPSHPADAVIEKMIHEFNRKGRSSGAGFYDYPSGEPKHLWERLPKIFPLKETVLKQDEMIERLMFIQAIESVRCLEEGVLTSVGDANIGSIFGWGFPAFKGGTLQFINDYGLARFVEKAKYLKNKFGKRFSVPPLLFEMTALEKTFR